MYWQIFGILGPPKSSISFWIEKAKTFQLSHKAMGKVSPILYQRSDMSGDTKSWSHKPSCQHSLSTLDSNPAHFLEPTTSVPTPKPLRERKPPLTDYKTGTRGVSLPRGGTSCRDPAFLLGVASEEPHIAAPDHSLWLLKKGRCCFLKEKNPTCQKTNTSWLPNCSKRNCSKWRNHILCKNHTTVVHFQ